MPPRGLGRSRSSPRTGLALALAMVTGVTLLFTQAPPLHLHSEGAGEIRQERRRSTDGTIFVSISSYRDDECSFTVQNMFDQADVPERVYVGVCEQNWRELESCRTGHLPISLRDHVQYTLVNASEAKGPTYGRAIAQHMYRGEDYYMQIDSHTQFAPGWDTRMVTMYTKLQKCHPKAVLSHYPASSEDLNDREVPRICNSTWLDEVGVFRFWEAELQLPEGQFVPTPYAAAGFMFFAGAALRDVPFDPQLPYLFDGEEILYSARLWTHGWDIFTPVENLIFHHYEREKAKSVYADHEETWYEQEQATLVKVRYLLGLSPVAPNRTFAASTAKYGMGSERTMQEYYAFANIDAAANTSHSADKFCGAANGRPPTACLASISQPMREGPSEAELEAARVVVAVQAAEAAAGIADGEGDQGQGSQGQEQGQQQQQDDEQQQQDEQQQDEQQQDEQQQQQPDAQQQKQPEADGPEQFVEADGPAQAMVEARRRLRRLW